MSACLYNTYRAFPLTHEGAPPWKREISELGCINAPQAQHVRSGPGYAWGITQQPFYNSVSSDSSLNTETGGFLDALDDASPLAMSDCYYGPTPGTSWARPDVEAYGNPLESLESYFQNHFLRFDGKNVSERPCQPPGPRKRTKLTVRERARNENGKFFCNICERRYARRERKETCQNNHVKEKTHHCRGECGVVDCTMSYASPDCLRRHQWTPGQRRALCPNCDSYTSKQNLARHKKRCQTRT